MRAAYIPACFLFGTAAVRVSTRKKLQKLQLQARTEAQALIVGVLVVHGIPKISVEAVANMVQ